MKVDLTKPNNSNFEATGKDLNSIMFKILGNQSLLKLLRYNTSDALSMPDLLPTSIKEMMNNNVRVIPKLSIADTAGSYIIIMFDTFIPNQTNPEYRDNLIMFDVICPIEAWIMDDYMLRPYKIMHELDSMFNKTKLNGIGKVEFISADSLIMNGEQAGYTMTYRVINDI